MNPPYVPVTLQQSLDPAIGEIVNVICAHAQDLDGRYAGAPLYYVVDELVRHLMDDGVFWSEAMIEGTLARYLRNFPSGRP